MLKVNGENTFNNLQINNGLIFFNVDVTEFKSVERIRLKIAKYLSNENKFLGATNGGVVFNARPIVKSFHADGDLYCSTEGTIITGWDVALEANVVEFSPSIIEKLLPNSVIDKQVPKTNIINANRILLNAEPENLVWFGDLSGGGLLAIELLNPLNVGGIGLNTGCDFTNSVKTKFIGRVANKINRNEPPFSIYFLN